MQVTREVIEAVRERCAQECDWQSSLSWNDDRKLQAKTDARAIRDLDISVLLHVAVNLAESAGASHELPQSFADFDAFLNEPPEYEDLRKVRDYRHEAYRKWALVLNDALRMLQSGMSAPKTGVVPHEKNDVSASHECGSVPDERAAFERRWKYLDFARNHDIWGGREKYTHAHVESLWQGWLSRAVSGMQPPATVEQEAIAKPDSDHLAVPVETSTDTSATFTKAQLIRAFNSGYMLGHNDTVEGIFSDIHWSDMKIYHEDYADDLIADDALPPAQSGISSPSFRTNEQNAVVQTEQPSLSDERSNFEAWFMQARNMKNPPERIGDKPDGGYWSDDADCCWQGWRMRALLAQRQPSLSELRKLYVELTNGDMVSEGDGVSGYLITTAQLDRLDRLSAQRQDSDRITELEAEVKQLHSERDAQQWYPFQDGGKDAAAPVNRYKVTKKSGIWYAHVVDTETDETIRRFDIRKNGWSEAEKCCERLNGSANGSVMAKDR